MLPGLKPLDEFGVLSAERPQRSETFRTNELQRFLHTLLQKPSEYTDAAIYEGADDIFRVKTPRSSPNTIVQMSWRAAITCVIVWHRLPTVAPDAAHCERLWFDRLMSV